MIEIRKPGSIVDQVSNVTAQNVTKLTARFETVQKNLFLRRVEQIEDAIAVGSSSFRVDSRNQRATSILLPVRSTKRAPLKIHLQEKQKSLSISYIVGKQKNQSRKFEPAIRYFSATL